MKKVLYICRQDCVDARGRYWKRGETATEPELMRCFKRVPQFFKAPDEVLKEAEAAIGEAPSLKPSKSELDPTGLKTVREMKGWLLKRGVMVPPGVKQAGLETMIKDEIGKIQAEAAKASSALSDPEFD